MEYIIQEQMSVLIKKKKLEHKIIKVQRRQWGLLFLVLLISISINCSTTTHWPLGTSVTIVLTVAIPSKNETLHNYAY